MTFEELWSIIDLDQYDYLCECPVSGLTYLRCTYSSGGFSYHVLEVQDDTVVCIDNSYGWEAWQSGWTERLELAKFFSKARTQDKILRVLEPEALEAAHAYLLTKKQEQA